MINAGTSLARERSNSLTTTRNRTASDASNQSMPPPKTIPLSIMNRPHSMYTNSYRHSNSPPVKGGNGITNPGPLSPSAGCSESDGSSLSIDEPDGCFSSLTPDDAGGYGMRFYG